MTRLPPGAHAGEVGNYHPLGSFAGGLLDMRDREGVIGGACLGGLVADTPLATGALQAGESLLAVFGVIGGLAAPPHPGRPLTRRPPTPLTRPDPVDQRYRGLGRGGTEAGRTEVPTRASVCRAPVTEWVTIPGL